MGNSCNNASVHNADNRLMDGVEFKKRYKNKCFYKLEGQTDLNWKTGLNIADVFDQSNFYLDGLEFVELDKIGKCLYQNHELMTHIREVEILDDSKIYAYKNKFLSDKFILSDKILLKQFPYWNDETFCKLMVKQSIYALDYVSEQTDELCEIAAAQNGLALRHVKNQTDKICLLAVRQNGLVLRFVKNKTQEICEAAIEQNENAKKYAE